MFYLGVDLGGTKIRAGLMDEEGTLSRVQECPTGAERGPAAVIADMLAMIGSITAASPADQVAGIGIGSPGPLDTTRGVILSPPNLPRWDAIPLADIVRSRTNMLTVVDHDARVAALAEYLYGAGQGSRMMVYVTISTGIGGGIVDNGRLLRGRRGMAGEFGHTSIVSEDIPCNCGNRGCWEAVASGTAIARRGRDVFARDITAKEVAELADAGDVRASAILEEAFFHIGRGVVNIVHTFDPDCVVIGGGLTRMGGSLLTRVRDHVSAYAQPPYREGLRIEYAGLRSDVGVIGAASMIRQELAVQGE